MYRAFVLVGKRATRAALVEFFADAAFRVSEVGEAWEALGAIAALDGAAALVFLDARTREGRALFSGLVGYQPRLGGRILALSRKRGRRWRVVGELDEPLRLAPLLRVYERVRGDLLAPEPVKRVA